MRFMNRGPRNTANNAAEYKGKGAASGKPKMKPKPAPLSGSIKAPATRPLRGVKKGLPRMPRGF